MTRLLLLLPLLLAAACGDSPKLVIIQRLAPGGGGAGDGGAGTSDRPRLDILVKMQDESTDFDPPDLMRLYVNGVERQEEMVMGGLYALLRIDPAPVGVPQFVELATRTGPIADTFTWNVSAYVGPTVTGVAPAQARSGETVTVTGTGFGAGPLRVFFGGVEGTVGASGASSFSATVPAGALPGPVWVLVGGEAAEGLVGFQPLDAAGQPVPLPTEGIQLFACYPARGVVETPVWFFGLGFDNEARADINGTLSARVFGIETVDLAGVGEILSAYAVVRPTTEPGAGGFLIDRFGTRSNELPFLVDG